MNAGKLPPKMRRSQAERTEAMRARLAAAAYETIAEGGVQALRMRTVAARAGVSQGALLHHFPDKDALILVSIEQALNLAREDSNVWSAKPGQEPEAILRAMLAEFHQFYFSDRFWVAVGIALESAKHPSLNPQVRERVSALRSPIYAAWTERLETAGWSKADAERTVRGATTLKSGASIRLLWTDSDRITEELEAEWIASRLALL